MEMEERVRHKDSHRESTGNLVSPKISLDLSRMNPSLFSLDQPKLWAPNNYRITKITYCPRCSFRATRIGINSAEI